MKQTKAPDAQEQLRHYYSAYRTLKGKYVEMIVRAEMAEQLLEELTNKIQADMTPYLGGDLLREFNNLARKGKYHLEMNKKANNNGR